MMKFTVFLFFYLNVMNIQFYLLVPFRMDRKRTDRKYQHFYVLPTSHKKPKMDEMD